MKIQNECVSEESHPDYNLRQYKYSSLSIFSYLLESRQSAVLIDPIADLASYLPDLHKRGARLEYILFSHYHADYLAGIDPASIGFPEARVLLHQLPLKDGSLFADKAFLPVGAVSLQILHTPGHTPESSCYLLHDQSKQQRALFTGDTLFIGDVGRPDLAASPKATSADLAKVLFLSLQKIKTVDPGVKLYPGHGSGSSCGKSIGDGNFCTLGVQMIKNVGLLATDPEQFMKAVLSNMPAPPDYFFSTASKNIKKSQLFKAVSEKARLKYVPTGKEQNCVLVRVVADLEQLLKVPKATLPVVNLVANNTMEAFAGVVVPTTKSLIVMAEGEQTCLSVVGRLLIMGIVDILGWCIEDQKARAAFQFEFKEIPSVSGEEYKKCHGSQLLVDVRKPGEVQAGHIAGSINLELATIPRKVAQGTIPFVKEKKVYLHCQAGTRARYAAMLLSQAGFSPISIKQGYPKLKQLGL